jgi:hypothetical protein
MFCVLLFGFGKREELIIEIMILTLASKKLDAPCQDRTDGLQLAL